MKRKSTYKELIRKIFLGRIHFAITFLVLFQLSATNSLALPLKQTLATDVKVYHELKKIPPTAQQVKVGFYTQNIYEVNPESNTYYMDFYVWFKWKGSIDPTEKIEFMNGVEDWGMTKVNTYETPMLLPDSSFYQVVRIEGRFRENFEFERYPLDEQRLGVVLENSLHDINEVVYIADTVESGYTDDLAIPGWEFKDYLISNLYHQYKTNFGDYKLNEKTSSYSAIRFELRVTRPINYFIWKLLFPLLVVLFASFGALLLDPLRVDSRIFLPITALLTIVFLQQAYSDALPAVSYLVLIDKIYVIAYILIIAAIMETIYTAGIVVVEDPQTVVKVKKIDRIFLWGKVLFLVVGMIILLLL
ncbi:MAG: hypothetical protein WC209_01705 [Ignavibacteriaceae bacterium]|jgi:hypothetical protein